MGNGFDWSRAKASHRIQQHGSTRMHSADVRLSRAITDKQQETQSRKLRHDQLHQQVDRQMLVLPRARRRAINSQYREERLAAAAHGQPFPHYHEWAAQRLIDA